MYVANGTVITRDLVHGIPVKTDELAISVQSLIDIDEMEHPIYQYSIEAGGLRHGGWRT